MAGKLRLYVDIDGPIAVYVQIENQIQFAIASKRATAGETLPSVRELSAMLNVNPNTITKAYRDLELMGLVRTRRGVGVMVTDDAHRRCQESTRTMVRLHLADAVAECLAAGLTSAEVRAAMRDAIDSGHAPYNRGE